MGLLSIRLPDDVDARLDRESEALRRPKSELAREAITEFLAGLERQRFIADIARAARARDGEGSLSVAEEGLRGDNEALALTDVPAVHDERAAYRVRGRKKAGRPRQSR
jgi:predicted transcriptional regulator